MAIPAKVTERLVASIKRFQPILASAKNRDVNESDTVIIVTDMLCDVFGYDKYSEITSEFAIRSTYCDLATKIDGVVAALIEVKAIGGELKELHSKQAIDYAANQGVDWVILTNGVKWKIFKVIFAKPVGQELVVDIDFCNLNPRLSSDLELLFLFAKEGWVRSVLGEYHTQRQTLSRFFIGAMLTTEPILDVIRRELRRSAPDVKVTNEQIATVLTQEVLKREVVEGEKADDARKKISRAANRALRAAAKAEGTPVPQRSVLPPASDSAPSVSPKPGT